jgi:hypothetical protein
MIVDRLFIPKTLLTALVAVFALLTASTAQISSASAASLSGTWRGGGVMKLNSGGQEKVRCKVTYFRVSSTTFSMDARCASGAGRIDQNGSLVKTSKNKYQGTVFNQQHGVTATVYITLHGRKQSVYISSPGGTGSFTLRK